MNAFWKPKFIQSAFVQITGLYLIVIDKIDGAMYFQLSVAALTVYSVAAVYENKVMK